MITSSNKLEIFENFRIDHDLPKFFANHKRGGGTAEERSTLNVGNNMQMVSGSAFTTRVMADGSLSILTKSASRNWFEVFKRVWIRALYNWFHQKEDQENPYMTVEEFFKTVKQSAVEVNIVKERAIGYEQSLKKALDGGQQALYETLSKLAVTVRNEARFYALQGKSAKYLDEETLVRFVKQAKEGLRLDWIANFTRVIPDVVLTSKFECDERDIFDNYVILHYDPEGKSYAETHKEIEKRKDPILFGVMDGRRRLYFVGDWVDEFCSLTFDQIAEKLGQDVVKGV